MKCPKCGYLGFEQTDRCRNCGYEFTLSESDDLPELPLRQQARENEALDDLALIDAATTSGTPRVSVETGPDLQRPVETSAPGRERRPQPALKASELPLFSRSIPDDTPLITKPSPPRPPLAVRRSTMEAARVRTEAPRAGTLDLSLDLDPAVGTAPRVAPSERAHPRDWLEPDLLLDAAGMLRRGAAVVVDLLILSAIDAVVIYFTMQICGVGLGEFGLVPKGPLVAFLVVQNVGYLVALTAGGQTLGKMAAGIKVVAAHDDEPIDLGSALKRTVAWLVLALPAGLGFLTAVLSRDHRGLHDHFAGSRVVRASA